MITIQHKFTLTTFDYALTNNDLVLLNNISEFENILAILE